MDREEFAVRTEAIQTRLYRTAYLYLGNEADALDAVDEAVYQALRAIKKLRHPEFFESWLTRILLNECHKELRRRKRLLPEEAIPDSAGPDEYDSLPLKEAIRRLPEEYRTKSVAGGVLLRWERSRETAAGAEGSTPKVG